MIHTYNYLLIVALVAAATAIPLKEYQYDSEEAAPPVVIQESYRLKRSQHHQQPFEEIYQVYSPQEAYELHRVRRSLQPGPPGVPQPQKQNGGWSANPNLGRDKDGNTIGQIEIHHKGDNHDFNAGWGKVIGGPDRSKPTWHIGGTFKW